MPTDETVDELIDKIIKRHETSDNEIKKRKTKPFRYIDEDELQSMLKEDEIGPFTVMKLPEEAKMVDGKECLAGLGDADTIESIIKRHEEIKRSRR